MSVGVVIMDGSMVFSKILMVVMFLYSWIYLFVIVFLIKGVVRNWRCYRFGNFFIFASKI